MIEYDSLLASLPPARRLALAYAPAAVRERLLALLSLDARLAGVVRNSHEPMLAQLRLAWWREQLQRDSKDWLNAEPLLKILKSWDERHRALLPLVDAWEAMSGPAPLPATVFEQLADARASAFASLSGRDEANGQVIRAARNWSLADLAPRLSNATERASAIALAVNEDWTRVKLPRSQRSLAVLYALARRAMSNGGNVDRMSAGDFLTVMRVGFCGR